MEMANKRKAAHASKVGKPPTDNPQRVEPFISQWAKGWRSAKGPEDKLAREIEREAKRLGITPRKPRATKR
jgi:hypothetical protein